tara:strand:+ start:25499 stop:25846 length:348 start_codon:yes stop_codon:yes gene_type:complete
MFIPFFSKEDVQKTEDPSTVTILEKPELKKPPLYRVIMLNDDYTPMEFVVYVLRLIFSFDEDKAKQIMLAIHTKGKGVCGIYTKEVAEMKSLESNNLAQENEHPLVTDIEPIEDD